MTPIEAALLEAQGKGKFTQKGRTISFTDENNRTYEWSAKTPADAAQQLRVFRAAPRHVNPSTIATRAQAEHLINEVLYGLDTEEGQKILLDLVLERGLSSLTDETVIELAKRQERHETALSRP